MSRLLRWYGASPLHLLTMIGCFALAGYAAAELLPVNAVGIGVWFVAAVVGHDLILMPLYTLADSSAVAVFRHRPLNLPAGPWINYLRVPAVLSGVLLLIWFPLIFRLPGHFPASTTLPLDPYLWHWLAVTGALFLLSATALALRLRLGAARRVAGPAPAQPPSAAAGAGTVLPDADLLDVHGAATTLYAVTGDAPSVLVFHRGAWWPGSHAALSAYQQQLLPQLAERGIAMVAISPQKPDGSLTRRHGLTFPVVCDPGNVIAGRLGILTRPPEPCRAAQRQLGLDLTSVNADGTVTLPMPAAVILDARHTVRWIDVPPRSGTWTQPQQVTGALDALDHPDPAG
ncbi:MAG TPA: peroxiredoxin-like family protein [Streptosporangiaceae bacterium]